MSNSALTGNGERLRFPVAFSGSIKKFGIITKIVLLIICGGSKTETDRAWREIAQFTPDHLADVKAARGAIQVESFSTVAIVQYHIEVAGQGDYKLLENPVSMAASPLTAGDIRKIVNAPYVEGYVAFPLNKSQIAPGIGHPGKFNDAAILKPHYHPTEKLPL